MNAVKHGRRWARERAGYPAQLPPNQFEAQEESTRTLSMFSLVSISAIFLILYAEFRPARTASLVMANLPSR